MGLRGYGGQSFSADKTIHNMPFAIIRMAMTNISLMLRNLTAITAFLAVLAPLPLSATFVNWTTAKTCPDGYELIRGDSWAPGNSHLVAFQGNLSGRALASLEQQLGDRLSNRIALSTTGWGKFIGRSRGNADLSYEIQITEYAVDRVSIDVFNQGKRVADYQFYHCN